MIPILVLNLKTDVCDAEDFDPCAFWSPLCPKRVASAEDSGRLRTGIVTRDMLVVCA